MYTMQLCTCSTETTVYMQLIFLPFQDGVFLLRLIGHNTNYISVSEVIAALWDNWHDDKIEDDEDDEPNANEDDFPMQNLTNHRPHMPPPPAPPFGKPAIPPKPGFSMQPSAPHMNEEKFEDPMYDPQIVLGVALCATNFKQDQSFRI